MTLIADLFALQEIDLQIDEREAALESLRGRPEENDAVNDARVELAQSSAGIPDLEARQRELDLLVAGQRDKIAPVEAKLYGGSVRNPKELQDLQQDLDQLNRQRESVEEELLAVIDQVETRRAAMAAVAERLETLEREWAAEQATARADTERIEAELTALRARRAAAAQRLPAGPLTAYDRLRRRRRGVAVVKVERGACLGCRLTVPTVILQRARSGANPNPVQCPSCERMLYVI